MAQYNANVAPLINIEFTVTAAQPYYPSGSIHGGLDISTGANDPIYTMTGGRVLYSDYNTGGYGNMVIIQDQTTGVTLLYAHMRDRPMVYVGQTVLPQQQIGVEGTTGQSTGIHLHLEIQYLNPGDSWDWNVPKLERPHVADFMGIPNQAGITAIYDGSPYVPPGPTPTTRKHNYKFVLFDRRNRANSYFKRRR